MKRRIQKIFGLSKREKTEVEENRNSVKASSSDTNLYNGLDENAYTDGDHKGSKSKNGGRNLSGPALLGPHHSHMEMETCTLQCGDLESSQSTGKMLGTTINERLVDDPKKSVENLNENRKMRPDEEKIDHEGITSVRVLQDKLTHMEEVHHSTTEELQATLQELADLQTQLAEFHADCERMGEEKHVLLESLCRQTEKLEDARAKVVTLQKLLLEEQGETPVAERELKLVDLLKSAQEERETLLLKQEELNNQLQEFRKMANSDVMATNRLEERINVLQSAQAAQKAEKQQLEGELATSKEEASALRIEINRLNTLLEHALAKISDLEQTRSMTDKSELEEVIDLSRKEKDNLESQVAYLQEQFSKSVCEVNKLTEQNEKLQEELKVSRNNSKMAMSDMEYSLNMLKIEKGKLEQEVQENKELIAELNVQVACHVDDKKQLQDVLNETQKSLAVNEKKLRDMEKILNEETSTHRAKTLEWEQFQKDLLVTVRVANNLKTEAVTQCDALSNENAALRDKLRSMETHIEKFKAKTPPCSLVSVSDATASVLSSVQYNLATRRSKQDNRLSVKSLIESIENATKQAKAEPGSLSSSNSSIAAIGVNSELISPCDNHHVPEEVSSGIPNGFSVESCPDNHSSLSGAVKEFERRSISVENGDPLVRLAKNGGSKRNALLKWCQNKTENYQNIDVTNFSTSWSDGLALCALLHTYLPNLIPYDSLDCSNPAKNFALAFNAAENVGIPTSSNLKEMFLTEKPDWKLVMDYITSIYKHFEP